MIKCALSKITQWISFQNKINVYYAQTSFSICAETKTTSIMKENLLALVKVAAKNPTDSTFRPKTGEKKQDSKEEQKYPKCTFQIIYELKDKVLLICILLKNFGS